jgi:hypothetical protein
MKTRGRSTYIASLLGGLALTLGVSTPAIGYHETLYVTVNGTRLTGDQIRALEQMYGTRIPSGHYHYDPATGRLSAAQTYNGSEQIHRGSGGQDYNWQNRNGGSWGYGNSNTGTNVICDSGGCNFAR